MARINRGILGGFAGKIGNVVGSSWKGIAVIKALPLSVANPRSVGQVAQRNRMSFMVNFAKFILAIVIKPIWDKLATQMSGYNEFVRSNIGFVNLSAPWKGVNLFQIAKGVIGQTVVTCAPFVEGSAYTLSWTDDSGEGQKLATDKLTVVLYDTTTGLCDVSETGVTRDGAPISKNAPSGFLTSDAVVVFTYFVSADLKKVSNSYAEAITVQ